MPSRGFGRSNVQLPERLLRGSARLVRDGGSLRRVEPRGSLEVGGPSGLGQQSVYAEFVLGDAQDERVIYCTEDMVSRAWTWGGGDGTPFVWFLTS